MRAPPPRSTRCLLVLALLLAASRSLPAQPRFPGATWEKAPSSEAAGWDGEALRAAFAHADSIGSAAIVIVQDGRVVAEWGNTARTYHIFSIRKSIQSALLGIQVAEGRLRLESTLAELEIDDTPPPLTPEEKRATLRDLLMARSGVYHPAAYETPGMVNQRPERGSHAPGTFWFYNNWDFNALGTISERAAGRTLFEEFAERIARPLQMEDFELSDTEHVREPVSVHPAYVFRMSARDLARFGLLFLNEGRWGGRQVVPAEWVRESTRPHSDIGIRGGYGYMWWAARGGRHLPFLTFPDGTYSARGTGEQHLIVVPAWRLVIVHRTDAERPPPGSGAPPRRMMRVTEFARLLERLLAARRDPGSG